MMNSGRRNERFRRGLGFILAAVLTMGYVLPGGIYAADKEGSAEETQPAAMTVDLTKSISTDTAENGLLLSKTAAYDASTNSAVIQLEAYVTGTVTTGTVEEDIPCDIVLVLDFSNSMTGKFTNEDQTRGEALQEAVNHFIDTVSEKYVEGKTEHRISLIYYNGEGAAEGKSAKIGNDWTAVTASNVPELKITDTERDTWVVSGTHTDQGMSKALEQLNKLAPDDELRSKVVVLFTDGELSDYKADDAINTAKQIKNMGCTVYTVATHIDASATADPALTDNVTIAEEDSNGNVTARYINAVMHSISSNYLAMTAAADNIAPKQVTFSNVTVNPAVDRNGNGVIDDGEPSYYLVANSTASLNTVFQSIASDIQSGSAAIQLDSSTVVKDIVSDYFELPANTSAVTVKTYECLSYNAQTGAASWSENGITLPDAVTFDTANKAVNVTGFDFSQNFVSENGRDENDVAQAGDFHGRKIVITFRAPVRDGFLGGNGVPTNGSATGVYSGGTLIEAFEQPVVDVPVKTPAVSALDYNVYLLGGKTDVQLKAGTAVTVGGQIINLDPSAVNYGLEAWQNAYINISADTMSGFSSLTTDTAYTARVVFTPKNSGTYAATSGSDTGKIYVYKPVVTYKDSTIILGDPADYETQNYVSAVWLHGASAAGADMGTAPELTYTYSPVEAGFQVDTSVKATVKLGTVDVTSHTAFYRSGCTYDGCSNQSQTAVIGTDESRVNFVVHVLRYDLTISKKVEGLPEGKIPQSFTFKVVDAKNEEHIVTVSNNSSATITVPGGTATVTEMKGNADGYSLTVKANGTDVTNGPGGTTTAYSVSGTGTVVFTNTYTRQTGSLAVTKMVTGNIPTSRIPGSFSITVTGQDGYSRTQAVANGGTVTFTDIPTGNVTIAENTAEAEVDNYTLDVAGSGAAAAIVHGQTASHTVTNDYTRKTTSVIIEKTVRGNMGDQSEAFSFTVTMKDTDNSDLSFTHNGNTVTGATFSLKHGESAVLTNVPVGAIVTVREAPGDYKTSAKVNSNSVTVTNGSMRFTVLDTEADSVVVINDKSAAVDTGIVLDSLPYILILAGVTVGSVGLFAQKRKTEDENL